MKQAMHAPKNTFFRHPAASAPGFTLLELLTVIAVIGVLTALTLPALTSLSTARGSANMLSELARGIELARSEALTGKTYTWLALMNTTDPAGRKGISFSVFASNDGTPAIGAGNLSALTGAKFLSDGRVVPLASVPEELRDLLPAGTVDVSASAAPLEARNGQANYGGAAESYALLFSPAGELILAADPTPASPYEPWSAIAVATMQGERRAGNLDAVLRIAGGSGQVQIVRK